MSRVARAAGSALLVLVLLALIVPLGFHWSGASFPAMPGPAVSTPPWQLPPSTPAPQSGSLRSGAPQPSSSALSALLAKTLVPDGAGSFSAQVLDAETGAVLYSRTAGEARTPASNMKLLTAAAALQALGPDSRFTTEVVRTGPSSLTIRGGGDVLLTAGTSQPDEIMGHAGLATLATRTVAQLRAAGVKGKVSVAGDDGLFSGPALNPAVDPGDVEAGETAPVAPMALNSARTDPDVLTGPRPQDQTATVVKAFLAALTTAGATGGSPLTFVAGGKAGSGEVLAGVESATVAEQVSWMLQHSDNFLTDVLGRMVAVKSGRPGSYAGAIAAVRSELDQLGLDTRGMVIADLSGLSAANRVSPAQFAALIRLMTTGSNAALRSALDGFPVAGLSGTLNARYGDASSRGGAGLVRAKTGTLNTVLSLSGYVVDADGRLLVFSFIGNGLTPGAAGNKAALDDSATVLAGCGCR
ncbi:D-alanyl-D-alanine carboxypeptidase/D-alanyl-D-alanine endopeptidase [Arthrobacter woluwensis]|nr:D-alanyl-D-alanine carboxypeptidase/D-alanyl-D-alanine-endopeptidase [Arthrobacter woluwensis]PSS43402.1 D-alanyl-D-alanine carboxypeptidase/D-alanyl-D-alanine-endopeptidase [Arthrobacter woluwensis]